MPYLMKFGPQFKAIRPTDNTLLSMPTENGPLKIALLAAAFGAGVSALVAVPKTDENLRVLGLGAVSAPDLPPGKWIVPPFQLLRNAFAKGGPFIRAGKIGPADMLTAPGTTYLADHPVMYRPDLADFIPASANAVIEIGASKKDIDRSEWRLTIRVGNAGVRMAEGDERNRSLVPWPDFAIGHLDLWLEQFRCHHLGLPVPTAISEPEEDIDFDKPEIITIDRGLITRLVQLDASAGDLAGQCSLWVEVTVDSSLDKAISTTGHYANGHFIASLASLASQHGYAPTPPNPDPEGQGTSFTGTPSTIKELRTSLINLGQDVERLVEVIRQADAQGYEFDD